jgi:hypothetical protein
MACTMLDQRPLESYVVRPSSLAGVACELEDLRTCERHTFASLECLCHFLQEAWEPPVGAASKVSDGTGLDRT